MRRIYLASSWRNAEQPAAVALLREEGHEVYDFRNPAPDAHGFSWQELGAGMPSDWTPRNYIANLDHPISRRGYAYDWNAMQWADTCVLLLPCGRSAHLEAGWFVGAGKDLFICLGGPLEPELMYKMATAIYPNLGKLLEVLR